MTTLLGRGETHVPLARALPHTHEGHVGAAVARNQAVYDVEKKLCATLKIWRMHTGKS